MVRIGGSTEKGSHIKEEDYYTPQGEFRVDREGSPVLLNCLMYKMCYYRFGQVYTEQSESERVGGERARGRGLLFPYCCKCMVLLKFSVAVLCIIVIVQSICS